MLANTPNEYGTLSKALHWLMAAMIIGLIAVGIYMEELPKEDPARRLIYGYHKALGMLALLLIAVRIVWHRLSRTPELPGAFSAKESKLVKGLQSLLYLLMLLVPLAGYVMSSAGGYPISFFGLFDFPLLIGKDKAIGGFAHEAHMVLGISMLAIVVLHTLGAIKHRLAEKGGERDILKRML